MVASTIFVTVNPEVNEEEYILKQGSVLLSVLARAAWEKLPSSCHMAS